MSLRRYCGIATALTLGLGLAFNVVAQDDESAPAEASEPASAEVTAAPDAVPAPTSELTSAHGPAHPGNAEDGEAKAAVCAACHGVDGNSPIDMYPKLAGQNEAYVARQLALFKDGSRVDAVMAGFASVLSPQDMRDLGAYFATQKVTPGIADDSEIASGPNAGRKFYEVGQRLYRGGDAERGIPACLACHGPSGRGNPGAAYPAVGGQHASYTVAHLEGFRAGTAWGEGDNLNTIMVEIAKQLTDEEIRAVASYIEGLHDASEVAAQ